MNQSAPQPVHDHETRSVTVRLGPPFEGQGAVMRSNFKAKYWADINSGDGDRVLPALEIIILEHTMIDVETGKVAETLGDLELDQLNALLRKFGEELQALPPR
jgi:hypothetical protein